MKSLLKNLLPQNPVEFGEWNRRDACFANKQAGSLCYFGQIQPNFAFIVKHACAAILSAAALAPAQAAAGSAHDFAWRMEITGPAPAGAALRARVPGEIWDGCEWGPERDLRIFDATGAEWPFFIWREPGEIRDETIAGERVNEVDEDGVRQFELKLGATTAGGHDKIRITFAENDYMRRVEVFGRESPDNAWGLLGAGFLVRIPRSPVVKEDVISYSLSTFSNIRVRIYPDPRRPDDVVPSPGADTALVRSVGKPEPRENVALAPVAKTGDESEKSRVQIVEFDAGLARPLNEIEIRADGEYARDARIYCRRLETNDWQMAGSGRISRVGEAEFSRISVNRLMARFWRVEIERGDDAPLANVRALGRAAVDWLVFEPRSGGPAHVYFGAHDAGCPHYDLARRVKRPGQAGEIPLGQREANPEFRVKKPTPKWAIPAGVALAAIIMLAVILSLLRDMSKNRGAQSQGQRN